MNTKKRNALIAAGFWFGDAEDFLQLTLKERVQVDKILAMRRKNRKSLKKKNAERKKR